MVTKAERDLEAELGPSPWPIYDGKDEPWKDADRMLKLKEKFDYQYEIAHVLGCSTSQVSYWMEKAEETWSPSLDEGDTECVYFAVCGYKTVGPRNDACDTCLDVARENQSGAKNRSDSFIDPRDSESLVEHMKKLYEASDRYDVNKP